LLYYKWNSKFITIKNSSSIFSGRNKNDSYDDYDDNEDDRDKVKVNMKQEDEEE
jgi:hypothetical protein